jgi:aminoglycoside phosphotransferase (APT) family kinase protein
VNDELATVLRPHLGEDVIVENLTASTGGASRATWAFDAITSTGRRSLILRTGPPDDIHAGMELQAAVQRRAAAAGTPVPHVLTADNSPAALGNPFLICEAIGGETLGRRIHRSLDEAGRRRLLEQCAQALAAIHRADPGGVGLTETDQLAEWRGRLDEMGDTTATFEWAFRRLSAHRPAPGPPRLVHGDFRMGNLIVDESGLAAVLDWELAAIGRRVAEPNGMCSICCREVVRSELAVRTAYRGRTGRGGGQLPRQRGARGHRLRSADQFPRPGRRQHAPHGRT